MPTTPDGIEVRLGADTSAATEGVSSAASSIKDHLEGIKSSLSSLKDKNVETTKAIVESNKEAKESFLGLSEAVRIRFGSINSAFEQFRTKLAGVAESFAALTVGREAVKGLLAFEDDVRGLEIAFGMSAEKATQLSIALKLAGSDGTQYSEMLVRLGERMRTNQSEFVRLGVVIKDSNGHLLDAQTILQNVYKRMQDFKAGSDQDLFVMDLLGRGAREFASAQQRLNAVQERSVELMHQLGIEMSPEQQEEIESYRVETNALKVTLEELGDRIGEQLLPGMERMLGQVIELGPQFAELGKQAFKALADIGDGFSRAFSSETGQHIDVIKNDLESLSLALAFARMGFMGVLDAIRGFTEVSGEMDESMHKSSAALAHLDFSGAIAAVRNGNAQMLATVKRTLADMKQEHVQYANDRDEILFGKSKYAPEIEDAGVGQVTPGSGPERYKPPSPKGAGDDRLAAWKDELVQMQEAEGYFHEMSKTAEAEFWEQKIALVQGKGKEEVKLRQELNRLIFDDKKAAAQKEYQEAMAAFQREIDAAKHNRDEQIKDTEARTAFVKATHGEESAAFQRAMDEETKIREAWAKKDEEVLKTHAKMAEETTKHEYEMQKLYADQEVAMRQISSEQRLEIERRFLDDEYSAQIAALQNQRDAMAGDPNADPVALAKLDEQLLKVRQDYETKATQLTLQAEAEREQATIQAVDAVQNRFATFFSSIADGTKSVKQAFLDLAKSIQQQLSSIASTQLAKKMFGPGTEGGNYLQSFLGKIFGGGPTAGAGAGGAASGGILSSLTGAFSSANGLLGGLFGDSKSAAIAQSLATTGTASSSGGLLGGLFGTSNIGSLFGTMFGTPDSGGGASALTGATQDAGTAGTTAAMTALSTVVTTTTTSFTLLDTITQTIQAAFAEFQASVQAASQALQQMAMSSVSGGGLGLGSLFGVPAFASGTPYVPQDMLAIVHQGEAIIPASMNRKGASTGGDIAMYNTFHLSGPTDARSQSQIAAAVARGLSIAQRRYL